MAKQSKKLEIDMAAGSQLRDTQGEILSVEGADISDLLAGRGRFNDNHGKGFFNSIGRITGAKKIFSKEDCENERQEYYWEQIRAPYLYVKGYLYNDEDHPNAKAAAAILRSIHKSDAPLKLKASVEGGVMQRGLKDPALLARTKIHSVALTFTPANNATLVEPLNLEKSTEASRFDDELIKSVMPLAMDNVPSFIDISERMTLENLAKKINEINATIKTLSATENPDELKKNLKTLKGLATAVAMLQGAHYMGAQTKDSQASIKPAQELVRDAAGVDTSKKIKSPYLMGHEELVDHIKEDHPHLWAIAHNESSGGKNLKHEKLKDGMHKGHRAGGPWALMPRTVRFIVQNLDKKGAIKDVYPQLDHMTQSKENVDKYHKDITESLNASPMLSFKLSAALYNHLHDAHDGDKDAIAHSWLHGTTGTKRAIKNPKIDITDHPYVQKFNNTLNSLKPQPKVFAEAPVEKALTAGYGGAGAPLDLTGGGVMQSLGGAKKGEFQYVTCNSCGKEQTHAANQVKCRECNKPFSLDQLFKLMS